MRDNGWDRIREGGGMLTQTRAVLAVARGSGMEAIVSAQSGETEYVTIVHLAVGWKAAQLKVVLFTV